MQTNQEEEGFPMEREIPRSEQLFGKIPKISNGHNSFIFKDNIVVFELIMLVSRAGLSNGSGIFHLGPTITEINFRYQKLLQT